MLSVGYWYRPVSSNGAVVHTVKVWKRMNDPDLRRACARICDSFQTLVEIERILQLPSGSRRYWLRRGDKWELYNPNRDADVRKPWPRWTP